MVHWRCSPGSCWAIYKPRTVLAPMAAVVLMIGATVYAQFGIVPAMERDRAAAGGAINTFDPTNPLGDFTSCTTAASTSKASSPCSAWRRVLVARAESTRS